MTGIKPPRRLFDRSWCLRQTDERLLSYLHPDLLRFNKDIRAELKARGYTREVEKYEVEVTLSL